jgi:hypothetical protein
MGSDALAPRTDARVIRTEARRTTRDPRRITTRAPRVTSDAHAARGMRPGAKTVARLPPCLRREVVSDAVGVHRVHLGSPNDASIPPTAENDSADARSRMGSASVGTFRAPLFADGGSLDRRGTSSSTPSGSLDAGSGTARAWTVSLGTSRCAGVASTTWQKPPTAAPLEPSDSPGRPREAPIEPSDALGVRREVLRVRRRAPVASHERLFAARGCFGESSDALGTLRDRLSVTSDASRAIRNFLVPSRDTMRARQDVLLEPRAALFGPREPLVEPLATLLALRESLLVQRDAPLLPHDAVLAPRDAPRLASLGGLRRSSQSFTSFRRGGTITTLTSGSGSRETWLTLMLTLKIGGGGRVVG